MTMKTDVDGNPVECPKCGAEVERVESHTDYKIVYTWNNEKREWVEGEEETGTDDEVIIDYECTACGESIQHNDVMGVEERSEACTCEVEEEEEEKN